MSVGDILGTNGNGQSRFETAVNSSLAKVLSGLMRAGTLALVSWMLYEINLASGQIPALTDKVDHLIVWTRGIETDVGVLKTNDATQAAILASHSEKFSEITSARLAAERAAEAASNAAATEKQRVDDLKDSLEEVKALARQNLAVSNSHSESIEATRAMVAPKLGH